MFVLKYVCIKICLFLIKKQQQKTPPTDRPTARAASVPRSVGRSAAVCLVLFIYKHTYFIIQHTYFGSIFSLEPAKNQRGVGKLLAYMNGCKGIP